MIVLLVAVIIAFSFGVYWLSGNYFSAFKIDIKALKIRILRAVIAIVITALSLFFHIILLTFLHLFLLWGLCELFRVLFRICLKKHTDTKPYQLARKVYKSGIAPILIIAVMFTLGYVNINSVKQTSYEFTSAKLDNSYRVVFISDTHYGTIQSNKLLNEKVEEINRLQPDIVILGGDIVEEGTDKNEMNEVFEALSGINSTHGTYFIYGNHDRQRYTSTPAYSEAELTDTISKNGIQILKDDCIEISNDILLVGREDLSAKNDRLTADALSDAIDRDRFILVADHQPNDIESNVAIGTDLQLSGHTHGGQIFPLGWMSFLYNGYVYGEYKADNTTVIVSSGFAGWGFPIRTQGVSEYVVVDLLKE